MTDKEELNLNNYTKKWQKGIFRDSVSWPISDNFTVEESTLDNYLLQEDDLLPIHIFYLFLTEEILEQWVKFTNSYYEENTSNIIESLGKSRSQYRK